MLGAVSLFSKASVAKNYLDHVNAAASRTFANPEMAAELRSLTNRSPSDTGNSPWGSRIERYSPADRTQEAPTMTPELCDCENALLSQMPDQVQAIHSCWPSPSQRVERFGQWVLDKTADSLSKESPLPSALETGQKMLKEHSSHPLMGMIYPGVLGDLAPKEQLDQHAPFIRELANPQGKSAEEFTQSLRNWQTYSTLQGDVEQSPLHKAIVEDGVRVSGLLADIENAPLVAGNDVWHSAIDLAKNLYSRIATENEHLPILLRAMIQ